MNAAAYSEPYKLPAGVLALVVHLVFFTFLYFGVSWHNEQPQGMVVDIWGSLPDATRLSSSTAAPQPKPAQPAPKPVQSVPTPAPEPQVQAPRKVDIHLDDDKKKPKPKPQEVKPSKPVESSRPAEKTGTNNLPSAQDMARQAQVAAEGRLVDEYIAKILTKVRLNTVMPPSVDDNARVEFDLTLLPGGDVLSVQKTRSSGNQAYDDSVERAIGKAKPLPLPADPSMFDRFRNLHLIFTPKDNP